MQTEDWQHFQKYLCKTQSPLRDLGHPWTQIKVRVTGFWKFYVHELFFSVAQTSFFIHWSFYILACYFNHQQQQHSELGSLHLQVLQIFSSRLFFYVLYVLSIYDLLVLSCGDIECTSFSRYVHQILTKIMEIHIIKPFLLLPSRLCQKVQYRITWH